MHNRLKIIISGIRKNSINISTAGRDVVLYGLNSDVLLYQQPLILQKVSVKVAKRINSGL